MSDRISRALALINDRLEKLHELLTEEPVDVVTDRYRAWKSATRAALVDVAPESVVGRFDLARGRPVDPGDRGRPTPPVFLDAAASRAFLMAMKKDLEQDPANPLGGLGRVIDLLERRLGKAFRGRPETERDVVNGFETLLAGADIAYEREKDSIVHSSRTYVPDFTFPGLNAVLDLKLCDRPDREKEITAEINDEIAVYRAKYARIVFGVYDLGFLRDPDRFSEALQAHDGVWLRVIKAPVAGC